MTTTSLPKSRGIRDCFAEPKKHSKSESKTQPSQRCLSVTNLCFPNDVPWRVNGKPLSLTASRRPSTLCLSRGTQKKPSLRTCDDCSDTTSSRIGVGEDDRGVIADRTSAQSAQGIADACKFVYNDAKFVNERARSDIVLLSRGIMRLDARARQDVAILGTGFLKLDARAREDTDKIDREVKRKAERLHHIAMILKDIAGSRLKTAADKHWNDGALEADLRRADNRAKQRAMEDALMSLKLVKNIHDYMVSRTYRFGSSSLSKFDMMDHVRLEKNGINVSYFPGEVSSDRISAIQDAYESMASAFYEADGIDYTDPEELELLITTLIDLDAMDGKSSVSLLAECSSSPDVSTRKALANALAVAPSMWTLGNAGMGALQRLSEDSNPAVARAATKAIYELKKQWEIEEGDSWRFTVSQDVKEAENDEPND